MTLKDLINSISKKEWRFVILLCIVMILITGLPYVYAYLNAPAGYFYNGIHSLTPGDSFVYFSYINQIKAGHWQLRDYFTSEAQPHGLLNFFWLEVGLFARIFNLPADLAFQLFRLLLIPIFFIVIYLFISYFFSDVNKRKWALIFICFSSGIGAYFIGLLDKLFPFDPEALVYKWPVDLWMPEANIFLTLYQTPHFICSLILLVSIFFLMLLALENNNYWYSFFAGLIGLYWFNFHPFYAPYVFAILFFYLLFLVLKTKKIKLIGHYLLMVILSLPFIFYHYYKIKTDLVIGIRASQNLLPSSPFIFVFLGFGLLLVFAVISLGYLLKNKLLFANNKYFFLVIWLIVGFVLAYSPIFYQRRFLQGLQIPMVFLTIILLFVARPFLEKYKIWGNKVLLIFLFIILFCFSTVFNLVRDLYYYQIKLDKFYLPSEYKESTKWLTQNNKNDKIILSYELNSQFIPGFVNQKVYLAHGIETIFYQKKREKVLIFFANGYNESQAKDFLKTNNIGYVFFTDLERKYAQFKPAENDYLKKVYSQGQIEIYEVIN